MSRKQLFEARHAVTGKLVAPTLKQEEDSPSPPPVIAPSFRGPFVYQGSPNFTIRSRMTTPRQKRLLQCPGCEATFERPSALQQHVLSHTGEKPHACEACHRRFSIPSNMRRHMRTCKVIKARMTQGLVRHVSDALSTGPMPENIAGPSSVTHSWDPWRSEVDDHEIEEDEEDEDPGAHEDSPEPSNLDNAASSSQYGNSSPRYIQGQQTEQIQRAGYAPVVNPGPSRQTSYSYDSTLDASDVSLSNFGPGHFSESPQPPPQGSYDPAPTMRSRSADFQLVHVVAQELPTAYHTSPHHQPSFPDPSNALAPLHHPSHTPSLVLSQPRPIFASRPEVSALYDSLPAQYVGPGSRSGYPPPAPPFPQYPSSWASSGESSRQGALSGWSNQNNPVEQMQPSSSNTSSQGHASSPGPAQYNTGRPGDARQRYTK